MCTADDRAGEVNQPAPGGRQSCRLWCLPWWVFFFFGLALVKLSWPCSFSSFGMRVFIPFCGLLEVCDFVCVSFTEADC